MIACGISRVLSAAEAGEGHLSGTAIAGGLERPTRDSDGAGSPSSPIWPCSEWGLPCDSRLRKPGALLPHPFTLACAVAPKSGRPSAVYSLRHFPSPFAPKHSGRPGVTRHPALWSSDFPPPEPPRWPDGDPHFAHFHTNLDEKSGATGAGSPIVISVEKLNAMEGTHKPDVAHAHEKKVKPGRTQEESHGHPFPTHDPHRMLGPHSNTPTSGTQTA